MHRYLVRGFSLISSRHYLVVQVWIRNSQGQWLISQRAPEKPMGLKWEPTGGSVLAGEESIEGALREVKEELGITLEPHRGCLFTTQRRDYPNWLLPGFLDVWVFHHDAFLKDIRLQPGETVDAQWVTTEELWQLINTDQFIPLPRYGYIPELIDALG